jgi:hypothetical protein
MPDIEDKSADWWLDRDPRLGYLSPFLSTNPVKTGGSAVNLYRNARAKPVKT